MKECIKCKELKEFNQFHKSKNYKDGFRSICKFCRKQYDQQNTENIAEYGRQYREKNADKIADRKEIYRRNNANKISEYRKGYRKNNAEKIAEYNKEYNKKNAEVISEYRKNRHYSEKDGLHHVYYLPDHNYVGTTDHISNRMRVHRIRHNRNTDNYQILASFQDRDKALRFESILHDSGFGGKHKAGWYR